MEKDFKLQESIKDKTHTAWPGGKNSDDGICSNDESWEVKKKWKKTVKTVFMIGESQRYHVIMH